DRRRAVRLRSARFGDRREPSIERRKLFPDEPRAVHCPVRLCERHRQARLIERGGFEPALAEQVRAAAMHLVKNPRRLFRAAERLRTVEPTPGSLVLPREIVRERGDHGGVSSEERNARGAPQVRQALLEQAELLGKLVARRAEAGVDARMRHVDVELDEVWRGTPWVEPCGSHRADDRFELRTELAGLREAPDAGSVGRGHHPPACSGTGGDLGQAREKCRSLPFATEGGKLRLQAELDVLERDHGSLVGREAEQNTLQPAPRCVIAPTQSFQELECSCGGAVFSYFRPVAVLVETTCAGLERRSDVTAPA